MSKEWNVEAVFIVKTSVYADDEKDVRFKANKALYELAGFIQPYCYDVDIDTVVVYDEEEDDDET